MELLIRILMALASLVQSGQPVTVCSYDGLRRDDLTAVLQIGDALIPDLTWYAYAANFSSTRADAYYTNDRQSIINVGRLWKRCGSDWNNTFTEDWFLGTFPTYTELEPLERCQQDNITLVETSGYNPTLSTPFNIRYWYRIVDNQQVTIIALYFPEQQRESFDALSQKLFPDLATCKIR